MSTQVENNNIDDHVDDTIFECLDLDNPKSLSFLLVQVLGKQGHLLMFCQDYEMHKGIGYI